MELLPLVAVALAVTGLVTALARTVRGDGYGHRPPPRSHVGWEGDVDPAS